VAKPGLYTVGGTVQAGSGLYISRQADQKLLQLCRDRVFAYVLTPRQMGKSSLMVQTAERLQQEGVRTAIVDLQDLGAQVTAEQWYFGFLVKLEDQLELETDVVNWWQAHKHLGVSQRLTLFFEQVLLTEIAEPIVIFVDEIDSTLSLDFTDDFFIAIRSLYVTRAIQPAFQRLSFVLIGVATPGDLIQDSKRTPFNIGKRVDLTDFTLIEAMPLAAGLELGGAAAEQALGWVLDWTGGHPYLTQRLCQTLVEGQKRAWSKADVDQVVKHTFFGKESRNDSNLLFVHDMLTRRSPNLSESLIIYRSILRNHKVLDEEQSILKSHLKLSGVVVRDSGYLKVRNSIYREVFNRKWIDDNLPTNWVINLRIAATFAGIVFLVLLVPISIYAEIQRRQAIEERSNAEREREIAEEKSIEAEKQRAEAEKQRAEAEKQRKLVEDLFLGGSSRVAKQDLSPEVKAFLDTLAWTIGTLPANGYQLKLNGEEFDNFADHPRERVCGEFYGYGKESVCANSAGRYHIISSIWDTLAQRLELNDFSPTSQDAAAVELLRERGALEDLQSGNLESAIYEASYIWVTLPDEMGNSRFGYKVYSIEELKFMYSIFYTRYKS
jgi:muramidase (phage lysozyme)